MIISPTDVILSKQSQAFTSGAVTAGPLEIRLTALNEGFGKYTFSNIPIEGAILIEHEGVYLLWQVIKQPDPLNTVKIHIGENSIQGGSSTHNFKLKTGETASVNVVVSP